MLIKTRRIKAQIHSIQSISLANLLIFLFQNGSLAEFSVWLAHFLAIIWIHGNKHKINVLQIDSKHCKLALALPWEFPYTAWEQLHVNVLPSLVRNRWSTSKKNVFKNLSVLMYSCCNGELWRSTTLMPVCKE